MDENQDLLFCDLETTGGDSKIDRIMEVGLVHVRNGQVIERYQQLVNPERPIQPFITGITGINNSMVRDQPIFAAVAAEIIERLEGKLFIAHSANFDYRFLQRELAMLEYEYQTKPICTVKLSRALYPEYRKHNLDILLERFNLTCVDRHRALDDAAVLWDLWQIFEKEKSDVFLPAIEKQLQKPKIELKMCPKIFDTLPDTSGVYIFSDDERPLFVGTAKNIQAQVKAHFSNEDHKKRDLKLAREMTKIEIVETVGPIASRIKMIEQKKKTRPRYNRKLNITSEHWGFRLIRDPEGFFVPKFFGFIPEEEGVMPGSFGLFSTLGQAEKKFRETLLMAGVFKTINPLMYNVRLELAFSSMKHHKWPLAAEFLLTENCPQQNLRAVHVFDQWCYLGSANTDEDVQALIYDAQRQFCPYLYPVIKSVV